jgi:chromosome segregation ATPase
MSAFAVRQYIQLRQFRSRFSTVVDADAEARRLTDQAAQDTEQLKSLAAVDCQKLREEAEELIKQRDTLTQEVTALNQTQTSLSKEISILEENLEDISFGIYKPHFDYDTPDAYKEHLDAAIDTQRSMIRENQATHFAVEWTVGGSRKEGERMQRQYAKLLLRAFNGEAEAAIARVAWNNADTMEQRIRKSFVAVNALGGVMHVAIVPAYLELKVSELCLEHELEEKKLSMATILDGDSAFGGQVP